jgi:hypothetical protein
MKNWRTTLAGVILSAYPIIDALMQAYQSGYFTDKTGGQLWLGIGFIVLGILSKDHNVTGGTKSQSIIGGSTTPINKDEK